MTKKENEKEMYYLNQNPNFYFNPYNRQYYYSYESVTPQYYALRQIAMLVTPDELTKLQGKKIRTTVPNLGSITATVGPYNSSTNRVELQNIVSVQDGVNHGNLSYLPSDLGGLEILDDGRTSPGAGENGIPPNQLQQTSVLKKTITKFGVPFAGSITLKNPTGLKQYRVWLEVTVPTIIAKQGQAILDNCMEVAKSRLLTVLAPFLTPATYGGLPAAIPGATTAALQAFTVCVGANPIIYPYMNYIKLNIKSGWD